MIRAALLLLALLPWPALAHEVGLSYGNYSLKAGVLSAELTFAEKELLILAEALDHDGDGHASEAEVQAARAALDRAVVQTIAVRAGTSSCAGALDEAHRVENDGLSLKAHFRCPALAEDESGPLIGGVNPPAGAIAPLNAVLSVELGFLDQVTPGHRHLVRATGGGSPIERIALRGEAAFKIAAAPGAAEEGGSLSGLFGLGVEHILTGLDHLLFLIGLLLVGGRVRSLLAVITAFTLAHSITLGLALLDVFSLPPSFVEPAIALSVAYVAIENWFVKDAEKRWRLTFAFGLLHGFGFAGALGRLTVPPSEVPLALFLFNLGVEVGQLLVLAVVLPAIYLFRRRPWFRQTGVRILSALIAVLALYWFIARIFGSA